MNWTKWTKIGFTVIASALILTACGSSSKSTSSSSTGSSSQVLRRMESDVISTMDPSLATDAISGQAMLDTMEGLYRYNGSKLEPALAKSIVEASNDGKTYTFKLRKSKWSNGDAVTAKDFVYSWQRTVDPATASQYSYLFDGVANAADIISGKKDKSTLGVKAVDDYTLEVTLDTPIPYFSTLMTNPVFFPQNEAVVTKYGKKYGTQSQYAVYNGPYQLQNWNGTGNSWKEVKNKSYWNAKAVKLSAIDVQVVKDPSTALNLFQSNKLDDVAISGEIAQQMKNDASYVGQKQSSLFYLEMNEKKVPALKNEKIRQAISMSINRSELVSKVLGDGSLVAKGVTPQGLFKNEAGDDFATVAAKGETKYTKYDPKTAKTLFAAGMKEAGVTSLNLELLGDDTDGAKKLQEYLQSTLQQNLPNLKVTISSVPFKTRLTRSQNGDFDMVITAWSADFPDAISFLDLFTSGNTHNDGKWSSAEYDKLIEQSKTTDATDATARWNTLLAAQKILTEQQGVAPLYQRVQAHLVNKNVKDMPYSPSNNYNFVHTYIAN